MFLSQWSSGRGDNDEDNVDKNNGRYVSFLFDLYLVIDI